MPLSSGWILVTQKKKKKAVMHRLYFSSLMCALYHPTNMPSPTLPLPSPFYLLTYSQVLNSLSLFTAGFYGILKVLNTYTNTLSDCSI